MKPRISVIVPIYNGAATLRATLDSMLEQTLTPFEVIIVNNNSTDNTAAIIAEYAQRHPVITGVSENHRSRGAARATGVAAARGDIIAMLDADCVASEHWLATLTQSIRESGEQIVQGIWHDTVQNYWTKQAQHADEQFFSRLKDGDYLHHFSTRNCALTASIAKQILFDPFCVAAEDLDFYVRIRSLTRIRFLDTCSVGVIHNATFTAVTKTSFWRGVWWTRVYKKHGHSLEARKLPHFESMRIRNMTLAVPGMLLYFLRRPFGEAVFTTITEVPWRLGVLWGYLRSGSVSEEPM